MKNMVVVVFILMLFTGCKKSIEKLQEDLVIKAMTDGKWAITSFTVNGTNNTTDFSGYSFKYYSNKTVDALKNGSVDQPGNWDGDANAMTTWANFPNAVVPLSLINGSWKIDRNSWTFVEATQVSGAVTKTMRLDKL
jgi:hypothetical protein